MKPEDRADDPHDPQEDAVEASRVHEFVKERGTLMRFAPATRFRRQQDHGTNQSPGHRHCGIVRDQQRDYVASRIRASTSDRHHPACNRLRHPGEPPSGTDAAEQSAAMPLPTR
jgi:hypothetical protein